MSEIQLMLLLNEWKQKLIKSLRVKHKPKICKRVATGFSYFVILGVTYRYFESLIGDVKRKQTCTN